jgi:hypothetical protein
MMSRLIAEYAGPPADRMAGRQQARAARAQAQGNYTPKKKISAATEARANAFLAGEAAIDQAIYQGVIGANMASHYKALWLADPAETHKFLVSLGLIQDSDWKDEPYGGNPDPTPGKIAAAAAEEYSTGGLSDAERGRIAAAREGRTSRVINGGL